MPPTRPRRRPAARALLALLCLTGVAAPAAAQDAYPTRPLQLMMPLPPGSGTDLLARVFATEMDRQLGQRVVVLNRTGAALTIAMAAVANAAPDGYTMVFSPATPLVVQPHRTRNMPFARDALVPVCQTFENVLHVAVPPNSRFQDLRGLLDYARANPRVLQYGHTGPASGPHLAGAELWQRAGVELTDVPYRGEADYAINLVNGTLDIGISTSYLVATQNLRSLAVFSAERMPTLPEVPTVGELGLPVTPVTYGGVFVRSDVPAPILGRLEEVCAAVVASPAYASISERQATRATYGSRAAFAARMAADDAKVGVLVHALRLEE